MKSIVAALGYLLAYTLIYAGVSKYWSDFTAGYTGS